MKKSLTFVLMGIFALFLIAMVSATTLVSPASSSTVSGNSVLLNATNGTLLEPLNCTFYAKSVSTANSTYVKIANASNTSVSAKYINTTFNSTLLEDANDYSIFASCWNATKQENSTANTGITIDNTVPQAPTLSPSTDIQITSTTTQTFTGTVIDANTTSCTYVIGRGGTSTSSADTTSGTGTYSGSSCTFTKTFTDSTDNGNWYWYITASDGTNSTASNTNLLQVAIPGASGGLPPGTNMDNGVVITSGGNNWLWIAGIILAVIIGVVFVLKKR